MPTKEQRLEWMRERQEEEIFVEIAPEEPAPTELRSPEGSRRPAEPREKLSPRTS